MYTDCLSDSVRVVWIGLSWCFIFGWKVEPKKKLVENELNIKQNLVYVHQDVIVHKKSLDLQRQRPKY